MLRFNVTGLFNLECAKVGSRTVMSTEIVDITILASIRLWNFATAGQNYGESVESLLQYVVKENTTIGFLYNQVSAQYGRTGCRVFKPGIQNWKDFSLKINIHT